MASVSFYLLTDAHYVSKKTWAQGKPITYRERSDQIALKLSPEILDAFIEKIIADKQTDTVLFLGDNVNNCDMLSHYEFKERLEKLTGAGKKVYVIYATHDYSGIGEDNNIFIGYKYTEKGREPIESMKKGELFDFYFDYGPKQALSIHEASGSYTVKLCDNLRMIFIIDNGDGGGYCGLDEDGLDWLKNEIKKAKKDGDLVMLATHHPVLPPWILYAHIAEHELYGGYRLLREIMCEEDVRVIFTGHTHVQNIKKYEDSEDRWFLDISTTALVNAAGKMRKVSVDTETGICDIKSIGIDRIDGVDTGDESLYEYLYHLNFPGIWEKLVPLAARDFEAFLENVDGHISKYLFKDHKTAIVLASRQFQKLKLSSVSRFSKHWREMTKAEKKEAKDKSLSDSIFTVMRHIFAGNAPFNPDTVEYKTLITLAGRADKAMKLLNVRIVKSIIPAGSSLKELANDFLYNNRTGNDDEITFSLKQ